MGWRIRWEAFLGWRIRWETFVGWRIVWKALVGAQQSILHPPAAPFAAHPGEHSGPWDAFPLSSGGRLSLAPQDGVEISPAGLGVQLCRAPHAFPAAALQIPGESLPKPAWHGLLRLLPELALAQILLQHLHQDVEVLQAFGGLPSALLALKQQQEEGRVEGRGGKQT